MKLNDLRIALHESRRGGFVARFVRRCTRWAWAPILRNVIARQHERGLINSYAFHEAHAYATAITYPERTRSQIEASEGKERA